MSIKINETVCNGCGGAEESFCVRVCPGDLLKLSAGGKAAIRDPRDCWDCAACVKACPRQAIEMYLPAQIGGRGATLKAKTGRDKIIWTLKHPEGREEVFEIEAEKVI
ncbi:MAG: 4Fe-4S binding protein [Clostridia bacterium]|nr:4Fe-4S binding protein [Clostridia bacterium]